MMQKQNGFYVNALPTITRGALENCSRMDFFSKGGWYLARGTALALQAGHRRSVDLDFFTEKRRLRRKKRKK